jgi:hypothetical protein
MGGWFVHMGLVWKGGWVHGWVDGLYKDDWMDEE